MIRAEQSRENIAQLNWDSNENFGSIRHRADDSLLAMS